MSMNRKLRYGMIGGGRGAFIGAVHRIAAAMDGQAELVAGAFSSDPARSKLSGEDLFLDPSRVYGSYAEMAKAEAAMPPSRRLDFVVIVTPNHQHYGPARLFLESGFNVVCDKPVTFDLAQAVKLRAVVRKTGKVFALTHNYTGNAMVKQARAQYYPQTWQQPIADIGADDANDEIAEESIAAATHDLAGKPTRNHSHRNDD